MFIFDHDNKVTMTLKMKKVEFYLLKFLIFLIFIMLCYSKLVKWYSVRAYTQSDLHHWGEGITDLPFHTAQTDSPKSVMTFSWTLKQFCLDLWTEVLASLLFRNWAVNFYKILYCSYWCSDFFQLLLLSCINEVIIPHQ